MQYSFAPPRRGEGLRCVLLRRIDRRGPHDEAADVGAAADADEEALRLSRGASSRLQQIAPDEDLLFADAETRQTWMIPGTTLVGMTSLLAHYDVA